MAKNKRRKTEVPSTLKANEHVSIDVVDLANVLNEEGEVNDFSYVHEIGSLMSVSGVQINKFRSSGKDVDRGRVENVVSMGVRQENDFVSGISVDTLASVGGVQINDFNSSGENVDRIRIGNIVSMGGRQENVFVSGSGISVDTVSSVRGVQINTFTRRMK